jgi:hypothetical protein
MSFWEGRVFEKAKLSINLKNLLKMIRPYYFSNKSSGF